VYICEGISDLRIYVTVTSPNSQDRGVTSVYDEVCIHIISSINELALYSTVYCRFVYHKGQVYGYDGGYEGDNLDSKVA